MAPPLPEIDLPEFYLPESDSAPSGECRNGRARISLEGPPYPRKSTLARGWTRALQSSLCVPSQSGFFFECLQPQKNALPVASAL